MLDQPEVVETHLHHQDVVDGMQMDVEVAHHLVVAVVVVVVEEIK
jgi:hypothetical protein